LRSGPDVVVHALPTATAMEVVPWVADEHCHGSKHYLAPARHHPHPILEDVGNSAVAGGNRGEATIGAFCVCVCGEEVEVNEEWQREGGKGGRRGRRIGEGKEEEGEEEEKGERKGGRGGEEMEELNESIPAHSTNTQSPLSGTLHNHILSQMT